MLYIFRYVTFQSEFGISLLIVRKLNAFLTDIKDRLTI